MRAKFKTLKNFREFCRFLENENEDFKVPYDYGSAQESVWFISAKSKAINVSGEYFNTNKHSHRGYRRVAVEKGKQDLIPMLGVYITKGDSEITINRVMSDEEIKHEFEDFEHQVM